jgi:hypothetical protein
MELSSDELGGTLMIRTTFLIISVMTTISYSGSCLAEIKNVDGNLLLGWCNANINRNQLGDFAMMGGSCFGYLTSIVDIQCLGGP